MTLGNLEKNFLEYLSDGTVRVYTCSALVEHAQKLLMAVVPVYFGTSYMWEFQVLQNLVIFEKKNSCSSHLSFYLVYNKRSLKIYFTFDA